MTACETCTAYFKVSVKVEGRTTTVNAPCSAQRTNSDSPLYDCVKEEYEEMGATPQLVRGNCLKAQD